ncbi:hypothetical protein [Lentzea albidocapillata]|uniref:hypothetical protein n=1 Tax=Lentzea albidocapillata TaxID=40571 RepID=UPI001FE4A47E|nr:hypothetical protein [Lentzea albidocapillata]
MTTIGRRAGPQPQKQSPSRAVPADQSHEFAQRPIDLGKFTCTGHQQIGQQNGIVRRIVRATGTHYPDLIRELSQPMTSSSGPKTVSEIETVNSLHSGNLLLDRGQCLVQDGKVELFPVVRDQNVGTVQPLDEFRQSDVGRDRLPAVPCTTMQRNVVAVRQLHESFESGGGLNPSPVLPGSHRTDLPDAARQSTSVIDSSTNGGFQIDDHDANGSVLARRNRCLLASRPVPLRTRCGRVTLRLARHAVR